MSAPIADLPCFHPALPARVHDLERLPLEHALPGAPEPTRRPDLHLKPLGVTFHRFGCDRPHRAASYWQDIWAAQGIARYVDSLREARQGVRR